MADSVAFGDMDNDVSMILAAGDGVAVANAADSVKAVADHVSDLTNNQGAVGAYLEALLG